MGIKNVWGRDREEKVREKQNFYQRFITLHKILAIHFS